MKKSFSLASLVAIANVATAILIMLILSAGRIEASHISAGNITYQAQGGGQYLFRLTLYRDCAGVTMLPSEIIYAYSAGGCAPDVSITVNLIPATGQQLPVSSCVQGANCYEEYVYEGSAFLPACSDWEIFYTTCCRNLPDNIDNINIPFNDFYISVTLNNVSFPLNSSPEFNYAAIGTFCVNNNFFFDQGATDPDGDQLTFSLMGALGFDGFVKTGLFYNIPYTAAAPLPCTGALTMNAQTGLLSFTPSMAGKFVIVIAVDEFDAVSGAYKGTTMRDMQVNISGNCNNIIPGIDPAVVTNGISANCGDTVINISLSSNIQCGTVAADGSDFIITENISGSNISTTAAYGNNCIIGLSNAVSILLTAPLQGGNYTIQIVNGNDNNNLLSECGMPMNANNTVQLHVSGTFNLSVTHADPTCNLGGSITASVPNLPGPFSYSIDGVTYGPSNTFTGLAAGSYTVYAQSGGNCTGSANVTLSSPSAVLLTVNKTDITCFQLQNGTATATINNGSPPFQVAWNTIPVQNGTGVYNLGAGTYTATVTDQHGCTASQTVTILQPDSISVTTSLSDTICKGQSTQLNAEASGGSGPYSYSWTPAMQGSSISVTPSQTTTYQVNVTDMNGCTAMPRTVTVWVRPDILLQASPDTGLCEGSSASLHVTASGGNNGPYSYNWGNGPGSQDFMDVTPGSTSSYTVTVSDGCTIQQVNHTFTVSVYPVPVSSFSADTTIDCYPLAGSFHDKSTIAAGSLVQWNWNFGDGSVSGNRNPHHTYFQPGYYDVSLQVTSDKGCTAEKKITGYIQVKNNSKPQVDFQFSPNMTNILNPAVNFTNNSQGSNQYQWYFGDGSGSSIQASPSYVYHDTGHFEVQLIATNAAGCAASAGKIVEIQPVVSFYVPNAFSPNGDGLNDRFEPKGAYIAEADMLIFNRWGQKVFECHNLTRGWDGTYRSQDAPAGVYTYFIQTHGSDRSKSVREGTFVLIR